MLMRFEPFREFDRLTEQLWGGSGMAMDAYRRGDEFWLHVDLPGVDPGSIELTVEQNVLTVSATRRSERGEGAEVVVAERPHGTSTRRLFLGERLDTDHIQAAYDAGVLTVRIPVADRAKPRKIEIGSGGPAPALESSTAG